MLSLSAPALSAPSSGSDVEDEGADEVDGDCVGADDCSAVVEREIDSACRDETMPDNWGDELALRQRVAEVAVMRCVKMMGESMRRRHAHRIDKGDKLYVRVTSTAGRARRGAEWALGRVCSAQQADAPAPRCRALLKVREKDDTETDL